MDVRDAVQLIAPVVSAGETWADVGAGTGTFTAALARILGPSGSVYAIERTPASVRALEELAQQESRTPRSPILVVRGDFRNPLELPPLHGALIANALHFVPVAEQDGVLRRVAGYIRHTGSLLVIEYDDRPASRWVPFPVSQRRLAALVRDARLAAPTIVGQRRSSFGGMMYAARIAV